MECLMATVTGVNPFARFENPTVLDNVKDSRLDKTVMQVVLEFFTTKDFPKIFNYAIQWISRFTEISPEVRSVGVFAGNVKNFYSFTKVPSSCVEVANAVDKLARAQQDRRGAAFRDVVRKVSDLSNNVCDTIKLSGQFVQLKGIAPIVDVVAAGFTAGGSLNNLIDDSMKVHHAPTASEKILHGFAIGMDISYLCVGIIGIAAFIIGAPISIILVPLTTALVCSISHFFFKNLADPEGKNRNTAEVQEALKWQLQLPRPPAVPLVAEEPIVLLPPPQPEALATA